MNSMQSPMSTLLHLYAPVVLASASPRRKKLLEQLGLACTVHASGIQEEKLSTTLPPTEYVQTLSLHKTLDIAKHYENDRRIVIGADTTVVLDGVILNKPTDAADAHFMLHSLSGRSHKVYTGITVADSHTRRTVSEVCVTSVTFRTLSNAEIEAYIAGGSPFDKAGGYGIQDDWGAVFISRIEGCYYNVVGLPLETLYRLLVQCCLAA